MTEFFVIARFTCEDASEATVGFASGGRYRLDENGQVTIERRADGIFGYAVTFTATVRRHVTEGSVEMITTGLTSGDEAQICETGVLDWTAERVRRAGPPTRLGDGLVRLR